jgi:hypothetical protein
MENKNRDEIVEKITVRKKGDRDTCFLCKNLITYGNIMSIIKA